MGKSTSQEWEKVQVAARLFTVVDNHPERLVERLLLCDSVDPFKQPTNTMSDITESIKKANKISQSNALTEAVYYLPIQAKRVLCLCLVQAYQRGKTPDNSQNLFTIRVADYQQAFGVNVERASREVKKGVEELASNYVTLLNALDGTYDELKLPWLALAGSQSKRGQWDIEMNAYLMPFLQGLDKNFTTYSLLDCGKITSSRAIRLYESCCQFRSTGVMKMKITDMQHRFELPASQRRNIAEFKRSFLEAAIKTINTKTRMRLGYTIEGENVIINIVSES